MGRRQRGSPKKGITIEHSTPESNLASNPFNVGQIDFNGSQDITIRGIYFDINKAQPVYKKDGTATGYVASIVGSGKGNTFSGALSGMTEDSVPCIWH